jgi:hypothetical protein
VDGSSVRQTHPGPTPSFAGLGTGVRDREIIPVSAASPPGCWELPEAIMKNRGYGFDLHVFPSLIMAGASTRLPPSSFHEYTSDVGDR